MNWFCKDVSTIRATGLCPSFMVGHLLLPTVKPGLQVTRINSSVIYKFVYCLLCRVQGVNIFFRTGVIEFKIGPVWAILVFTCLWRVYCVFRKLFVYCVFCNATGCLRHRTNGKFCICCLCHRTVQLCTNGKFCTCCLCHRTVQLCTSGEFCTCCLCHRTVQLCTNGEFCTSCLRHRTVQLCSSGEFCI